MACPQSKEDYLLVPLELVDRVNTTLCTQPSLPLGLKMVADDGLGFSVGHGVAELLDFPAGFGESISLFIAHDPTVRRNPLECYDRLSGKFTEGGLDIFYALFVVCVLKSLQQRSAVCEEYNFLWWAGWSQESSDRMEQCCCFRSEVRGDLAGREGPVCHCSICVFNAPPFLTAPSKDPSVKTWVHSLGLYLSAIISCARAFIT